ncbi:MAG: serine/threonine-protein kinase [Archangium sp.]
MTDEVKTQFVQVLYGGRWRLIGRIGAGGMGNVLLATDQETGEQVALKTLGMELLDKPEFVRRFEREAQLLAKLSHPGLPPYVAFAHHDGMPFIVMKYVEGQTVGQLLTTRHKLTPVEAVALLRQLADVLEYLHARGVVHRDLKPDNLLLDTAGRVTLIDFGISAQTNVTRLTLPGVTIGTPLYMAPEVITTGEATPASDVYALTLLAYTMLTGRHPFAHDDRAGMFTRQVKEVPLDAAAINPSLPSRVADVLQRGLEKEPRDRFASATKLVDALAVATGLTPTDPKDTLDTENPFEQQAPTVIDTSRETRIERVREDSRKGPRIEAPASPPPERVTEPDRAPVLSARSGPDLPELDGPTSEVAFAPTHIEPEKPNRKPLIIVAIAVGVLVLLVVVAKIFS